METNWYHMPKEWHNFMGSMHYEQKVNYTLFLKAIHDFCYKNSLYEDLKEMTFITRIHDHSELENLLKITKIAVKDLDERCRFILEHTVKQNDGSYMLLWDYVKIYPHDMEETLEECYKSTGICNEIMTFDQFSEFLIEELNLELGYAPKKMKYLAPILHLWNPYQQRAVSGFAKPRHLSNDMCDFLGEPGSLMLSRAEVTKRIIAYITANDLWLNEFIIPDSKLEKIFGNEKMRFETMKNKVKSTENCGVLTFFNMQTHLNKHFLRYKRSNGLIDLPNGVNVLTELKQKTPKIEPIIV